MVHFRQVRLGLTALIWLAVIPLQAAAESIRVATFKIDLSGRGPGLLLRDLLANEDPRIDAVAAMIAQVAPDILAIQGIDYDAGGATLAAFARRLAAEGHDFDSRFALRPNSGMATGIDLDGDGYRGDARDAQGYGRFAGAEGMAILSRYPILAYDAVDFSALLWRELPGAIPPLVDGASFPSEEAMAVQRLSSVGHWVVPVAVGGWVLNLLTWSATPPVFDGPEDRNGKRNHDETALWLRYLEGALPGTPPEGSMVLLGNANLDPVDGDGRPQALRALLDHPLLFDPEPRSDGGDAAGDADHAGDPALDTADYDDDPGNLRVDYLLVSRDLDVTAAGVHWPAAGDAALAAWGAPEAWPRHRIVWADIELSAPPPGILDPSAAAR